MLSEARCSIQIPEVIGLEKDVLTVGRHFYLNCEGADGSWDRAFDFSKAFVVLDDKNKNTMKVFKIEARNANSFDVNIILYVTGELKISNFKISDGTHDIDLGAQTFKVKSVLEAKTEKPPEPFGYIISHLEWPWQYSAAALIFFVLSMALVIFIFLNKMKWRGRFERLKQHDSPLLPDSQFYKEIRKSEKKEFLILDLEKILKLYILRRYRVPIFELSNRQTIILIKKTYPRLKNERRQIFNLFKDMEALKKTNTFDQRKKFVEHCYRFVEVTEDLKQRGVL